MLREGREPVHGLLQGFQIERGCIIRGTIGVGLASVPLDGLDALIVIITHRLALVSIQFYCYKRSARGWKFVWMVDLSSR